MQGFGPALAEINDVDPRLGKRIEEKYLDAIEESDQIAQDMALDLPVSSEAKRICFAAAMDIKSDVEKSYRHGNSTFLALVSETLDEEYYQRPYMNRKESLALALVHLLTEAHEMIGSEYEHAGMRKTANLKPTYGWMKYMYLLEDTNNFAPRSMLNTDPAVASAAWQQIVIWRLDVLLAVASLPRSYQWIFWAYYEGYSTNEIALLIRQKNIERAAKSGKVVKGHREDWVKLWNRTLKLHRRGLTAGQEKALSRAGVEREELPAYAGGIKFSMAEKLRAKGVDLNIVADMRTGLTPARIAEEICREFEISDWTEDDVEFVAAKVESVKRILREINGHIRDLTRSRKLDERPDFAGPSTRAIAPVEALRKLVKSR